MRSYILLLLLLASIVAAAQTPFTTYKTGGLVTQKSVLKDGEGFTKMSEKRKREVIQEAKERNQKVTDSLRVEYFDHLSANAVFIQNSQKMFPTINGEIMNYKFGIWTRKIYLDKDQSIEECNKIERKRNTSVWLREKRECMDEKVDSFRVHYLPFSIITKLSANYVDSSAGPTHDATSFFGAPLTLRFSPAADLTPHLTENKLFVGLNADLRLLTIADTVSNKLQTSWGAYVSAGFSYLGKGFAYQTDEAERHDGKYSISAMLYWFKSGGEFNKALFGNYEKKTLSGIEILLRFKTTKKEDSRFNFLFGANNGFTRGAPNFAKWQFQLGIGT